MTDRASIVALATATTLSGCMQDNGKSAAGSNDKATSDAVLEQMVIENVAQNVIVASYRDLRDSTRTLADSAVALQANPTQANLEAVQAKWKLSRIPWESTEGFLFGPVNNVDKQIDVWPLSKIDLDRILGGRTEFSLDFIRSIEPSVKRRINDTVRLAEPKAIMLRSAALLAPSAATQPIPHRPSATACASAFWSPR